jgi:hypothetical protein
VVGDDASLEDLGSRNGVLVNGERLRGTVPLQAGDRIVIGGQELTLTLTNLSRRATKTNFTQPIPTKGDDDAPPGAPGTRGPIDQRGTPLPPDAAVSDLGTETRHASSVSLLLGVATKALALGKLDDASRILANLVAAWDRQLLSTARKESLDALEGTALVAVQVATATGRARWVDWVFEVYRKSGRLLTASLIDELHAFVRKTRYPATPPLRAYVEALRAQEPTLRPAERFLLSRIEGLLEVAAAN